jgi:hypothetical protein
LKRMFFVAHYHSLYVSATYIWHFNSCKVDYLSKEWKINLDG